MQRFRTILFWCHLTAGVSAGIVVLIMSVTGVLLTYEKQMMYWADTRALRVAPPSPGAPRLPIDVLLERVRAARPDAPPQTLTLRNDPSAPAAAVLGRDGTLYVDPYTGAVLGSGSPAVRGFFRGVTNWHRWLAMSGEHRAAGRAITGAGNLVFLFIVCSGIYLWFPGAWTRVQFKKILWFRRRLPGKARDFNWHNVAGFWSAIPLAVIVASGTIISYPWASNLVYRAVGEQPPPPARGPGPAGGDAARAGRQREGGRGAAERPTRHAGADASAPASRTLLGLDDLWTRAERQVPGWRTISVRIPAATAPVAFTIDRGTSGQPHKRAQLTLDRASGAIVRWEPFSSQTRGRQLRSILRFAHTGEVLGLAGQTIAGIVSAAGALLVYTGLALSLRRFVSWRRRNASRARPLEDPATDVATPPTRAAARRAEARPALE
jgi:uncharacterized iron-regulated membrane protein